MQRMRDRVGKVAHGGVGQAGGVAREDVGSGAGAGWQGRDGRVLGEAMF